MLRLGLVYRCWPLPISISELSTSLREMIIARTDALLAREQGRSPPEDSDA